MIWKTSVFSIFLKYHSLYLKKKKKHFLPRILMESTQNGPMQKMRQFKDDEIDE